MKSASFWERLKLNARAVRIVYFFMPALFWLNPSFAQLHIQNYGIPQGLPQSQVFAMAEDRRGYLWLGTLGGGLSRFDGQTFETFTSKDGLVNNFVRDIFIDSVERVWVATNKGISLFDGIKFHSLKITDQEGCYVDNLFINGKEIFCLLDNGEVGRVWYDGKLHYEKRFTLEEVRYATKSVSGATYIVHGTPDALMLTQFGNGDTLTVELAGAFRRIHSVFRKDDQDVLSTNEGLFVLKDGTLTQLLRYKFPVYGYNTDRDKFIGINESKISLIDTQGGVEKEMDSIRYMILTTLMDRDETLWLGTDQGLFKIYPLEFENPLLDKGRLDAIQAICMYDDKLWIGTTYQGIKVYSKNQLVKRFDFKRPGKNYVTTIKTDRRGKLWVGSLSGVATYDNGDFNWLPQDVIASGIAFDFDKNNDVLIGGAKTGLYQIKNGKAFHIPDFRSTGIWCIKYNEAGDYFVIGTTAGVKIFKEGSVKSLEVEGLQGVEVSSLEWLDDQTLVMGTLGEGIVIYSFATKTVQRIDVETGLLSNTIFLVFIDSGKIWVGSEKGIDLISYDQSKNQVLMIDHFNDANGLSGLETNLNAVCRTGKALLFGLVKGLYEYKPRKSAVNDNKLHLKNVNLFYEPIDNRVNSKVQEGYALEHNQNHLTFNFNKVDKRNPDKYYYTYRLTNFDQIWSKPSQSKSVTYGNLPPGSYSFELRATDKEDVFTFEHIDLDFTIQPAFYQTLPFRIFCGVLLLLVVIVSTYWFYTAKARRALAIRLVKDQEQARLRKEIARDFHDELGNQVARMLNYVGLLRISEKMERDTYATLHGYSHAILTGTKDFVWALDPRNDDLESVLVHLRDFGERMFTEKEIKFSFDGEFQKIKLPMGYGRQINLIFKEAMTNAFKHSGAKSVQFGVRPEPGNKYLLQLYDDGTGLSQEQIIGSQRGIENMRLRALKVKSQIQITSNGKGLLVTLVIAVPENIV